MIAKLRRIRDQRHRLAGAQELQSHIRRLSRTFVPMMMIMNHQPETLACCMSCAARRDGGSQLRAYKEDLGCMRQEIPRLFASDLEPAAKCCCCCCCFREIGDVMLRESGRRCRELGTFTLGETGRR